MSLSNSSSLSFLNDYAPPIRSSPTDGRTDSFSFSILSSCRNLFILGYFNCHHPLWISISTSHPRGEEVFDWVIFSDLFPLNDSGTPTLLHRSSGSRFPPDISLLPILSPFLAHWKCFRAWVLITFQFFYMSLFLRPIAPTSVLLPSIFPKLAGMTLPSYFNSHCSLAEEYWSLSLSSAATLFTSLALNAAKSSIPFGLVKRHSKAWWSAGVESAVSERRKAFAGAHRSDKNRRRSLGLLHLRFSTRFTSVIAKAKAEAWQTTCSSLSPKSKPKSIYSLLRFVPDYSSSSPNFPNSSSPRESASVYAAYLRSHFSVSQPKGPA